MSPRLTSISSSRQTATDMGANASSSSPSQVTMDFTRLVRPEGSTVTGSPRRTTPEASVPAKARKSRLGRMTYCTGNRRSVRLMSRAMGTVSRCSSSAGPSYHGVRRLRLTTLSPSSALMGMYVMSPASGISVGNCAAKARNSSQMALKTSSRNSIRSILLTATTRWGMPSSAARKAWRRDCGSTP